MLDVQRSSIREANELLVRDLRLERSTYMLRCECGETGCATALTVHEDDWLLALRRHGHIVAFEHVSAATDRRISCHGEVCIVVPRQPSAKVLDALTAVEATAGA